MDVDYLVVGAGAAGCALASRLSEDPSITVLLLETGAPHWTRGLARVPRALPAVLRSPLLVSYPTQPLRSSGLPDYWVRGRGVGGSTLVNGMMYLRGEPDAYQALADATSDDWGWAAFEAAYRELEARYLHPTPTSLSGTDRIILRAIKSLGVEIVEDINAVGGSRAGATPATIHAGQRRSSAAFLAPARERDNLHVLSSVWVESLTWQGTRVTGVIAHRADQRREIRARTVVLCAGTIQTPLLLERSGIGHPRLLAEAGIEVRVDSPQVGERVREQRGQSLQVRLTRDVADAMELGSPRAIAMQAARYAATGGGPLARPAYDVAAVLGAADIQRIAGVDAGRVQVMAAPFALADGERLRPARYPGVLLSGYPISPTTTSSIHINPADRCGPPIIDARYVETDRDRQEQEATLAVLRRVAGASPLGELIDDEDRAGGHSPGSAIYHAVGSAAMGNNDEDVVDLNLGMRGARGLRIADLSVLPFHPSGGTAAPAMALGWLAGALLTAEHHAGY